MSDAIGKKVFIGAGIAKYLGRVADALNEVGDHEEFYGTFYIGRAELYFDGEPSGLTIEFEPDTDMRAIAITEPFLYDIEEED